jgi:GntR family transcriptional regulator
MVRTPLYKEIKNRIVTSLIENEWPPGELIPNEKQLAEQFSVGISTVRAAIGQLVAAGVLARIQGKGTFVTHHSERTSAYRFFNLYQTDGVKTPFYRELVRIRKEHAGPNVASALRMDDADKQIYKFKLHMSAHRLSIAVAESAVPADLFPDLDTKLDIEGDMSLYAFFQTVYAVNVVRVVEKLTSVGAPAAVAKSLALKAGEPLLRVDRTAYTFNDKPVEIRTTWINTRHHHYLVDRGDETS